MNWFRQEPIVKYQIIEVEKPKSPEITPDAYSSVASLKGHSGFQWLVRKLKLQAANLQHELQTSHHEKMEDVIRLQSGIFWCKWLESQVNFADIQRPRAATSEEVDLFNQISSTIERVGHNPTTDGSI